ncbi:MULTISPECIES: hypothetical protein [Delftia]|jgi:hypothetical protein|uniref:hypothetical protein n=1 Tax=Delftia TaxID=80865 RepID=UPI00054E1506|nr:MULTISPECIES: hypothetical protein [Delftia]MDR3016465.1 hypothetical protein [Delftia acidovorans]
MTTPAHQTRHRSATVEPLVHDKQIALRLTNGERHAVQGGASHEGRSQSNFARMIHLMGMELYEHLGRIELGAVARLTTRATDSNATGDRV